MENTVPNICIKADDGNGYAIVTIFGYSDGTHTISESATDTRVITRMIVTWNDDREIVINSANVNDTYHKMTGSDKGRVNALSDVSTRLTNWLFDIGARGFGFDG